jgi:uncharacterized membrane protein SirB2
MLLKDIHLTCVALTFVSFSIRGIWLLSNSPYLQHNLSRVIPHVIDTILLLSGIAMVIVIYQAAFLKPWLITKIIALTIYIILGSFALKYGKTRILRITSLFGAWLVFFYIIAVAITKSPSL